MRKFVAIGVALGLVVGSLGAPALAKKKKKPVPTEVTFWFTAEGGCSETFLKLTEATEGSNCGRNPFYGAFWDVGEDAGLATPYTFPAIEGVPFVMDGTKPIVATVQVSSYLSNPVGSGVGQATLIGTLTGEANGESVDLGTVETSYTVTPAQGTYEVVLEFAPAAEFDKAKFTALAISLTQKGTSVSHGHYRTVNPASKMTVPTLK